MRIKKGVWRYTAETGWGRGVAVAWWAGKWDGGPGLCCAAAGGAGDLRASQLAVIWAWLENRCEQLEPDTAPRPLVQAPEWKVPVRNGDTRG